jgi:hypothetical protein
MNAALTLGIAGTGINVIHAVSKGKDPFPVAMAGTILTVLFVALESSGIGTAAAAVYLLGAFLINGTEFIDVTTGLVNSPKAK